MLLLRLADGAEVSARLPRRATAQLDEEVRLHCRPGAVYLFDAETGEAIAAEEAAAPRGAGPGMSRPLRIGLIGAGWVTQHHLEGGARVPDRARVVAIADPSRERRSPVRRPMAFRPTMPMPPQCRRRAGSTRWTLPPPAPSMPSWPGWRGPGCRSSAGSRWRPPWPRRRPGPGSATGCR